MIAIPIERLKAGDPAPFPLFLFLRRNDRMVPVRLVGDPMEGNTLESFLARGHTELWVPRHFEKQCEAYLSQNVAQPAASRSEAEEARSNTAEGFAKKDNLGKARSSRVFRISCSHGRRAP
jgi:hypothetical protein